MAEATKPKAESKATSKEDEPSKKETHKGQSEASKKETTPPKPAPQVATPAKDTPPQPHPSSSRERPPSQVLGTAESSDYCYFCSKRLYLMEKMSANGLFFHRSCFKCSHCKMQLGVGGYALSKGEGAEKGKFFCTAHYRQLFLSNPEAINYSRANPGAAGKPTPTTTTTTTTTTIPEEKEEATPPAQVLPQPKAEPAPAKPGRQHASSTPPPPQAAKTDVPDPASSLVTEEIASARTEKGDNEGSQGDVRSEGKPTSQNRSTVTKPVRPAPPPPSASPKQVEKANSKEVAPPPTQPSPKMPEKPLPYGSTKRSTVHDLTQQCNRRDEGSSGGGGGHRPRSGSGLPQKESVLSPTRG